MSVRGWGGAAAAVMAAACLALTCPGTATAASAGAPQAGYWWQPEPVSGLIPVPGVPADGLYVAASPTGPQAESAVRFAVTDPGAFIQLTLHVSMQERVGSPAVVAYPATSRWQTGGPQSWSARPSYRASAKPAEGLFGNHGTTMKLTFPAAEATTGIVLVPDPNSTKSSFTIAFAPPRASDIAVRALATSTPSASSSAHPPSQPLPSSSHSPRHSARPSSGLSHPTRSTAHSTSPSPSDNGSASASPSESIPPTPGTRAASPDDEDHPARDVILISAAVVAAALVFSWWRAARRR